MGERCEVAASWGLDRKTVYAAIRRREIPALVLGSGARKCYLVPREFVERTATSREGAAGP